MNIGIMCGTFIRPTLEERLDAVASYGINHVQFSTGSVGMPDNPEQVDTELCNKIRQAMDERGITMSALSGTFNMIHPDLQKRLDGLRWLSMLASASEMLGTSVITLCTGTRDPESMWRRHPENDSPEAWEDLVACMHEALKIAEENEVFLAFEPEVSNVVDSAIKGKRLIEQMQSPYLKVVMDPANIFHTGELPRMQEILDEAFELLGEYIAIAHAKDLDHDGAAGHKAAGEGLLDYERYLSLLDNVRPDIPLILHGLNETQVEKCIKFLQRRGVK